MRRLRGALSEMSLLVVLCAFILISPTAMAQKNRNPNEGISHQQADAILEELKAIRELIASVSTGNQGKPVERADLSPVTKQLKIDDLPVLGSRNARVTIAEFFDYQCPFCRDFHLSTFEMIRKTYIDTGRVRFVSIDLPLPMHADAAKAAEAAHCGGDQGRFWEMRDRLSRSPEKLGPTDLLALIRDLPIEASPFEACMDSGKYKARITAEGQRAASLNINVTPTFVVGRSTLDGVQGTLILGAQPLAVFETAIKAAEVEK